MGKDLKIVDIAIADDLPHFVSFKLGFVALLASFHFVCLFFLFMKIEHFIPQLFVVQYPGT